MNRSIAPVLGQCSPAKQAARPQTQVEGCLNHLASEIESLDKAIAEHYDRLQPVMRAAEPLLNDGKTPPPEELLCERADTLRTFAKRIAASRNRISELTERLEA